MVEMAILSGREDCRNLQLTRIYLSTPRKQQSLFQYPRWQGCQTLRPSAKGRRRTNGSSAADGN